MTDDHVNLREYIERILDEREKQNEERIKNMDRRLEGMNEVRAQLDRQAGTFVSREYYDAQHQTLVTQLNQLQNWRAGQEGKQSRANLIAIVAAVISAASVGLHLLR